jgi:2-phospho-L-lactate guanylyltransferase
VQATVRTFDATTRSGTVLLDDGVELPYGPGAFDASGLRLLRVGQRVRIAVADSPTGRVVDFLTVATRPDPRRS